MKPVTDPGLLSQLEAQPSPVTDPGLLAQLEAELNVPEDVRKSAVTGVAKGAIGLAGLPGDLGGLLNRGIDYALGKVGITPSVPTNYELGGSGQIQRGVEKITGEFYKPQTTIGKYAQTAGEFAPGVLAGPGGIARRAITQVAVPAAGSEVAGQATEGTALEPYARVAGALAGPAALAAGRRIVTPSTIDPRRQALIDTLADEGVNLTAGQRTGSKALQYTESTLGDFPGAGGAATRAVEGQQQQFTQAALRRIGMEGAPTRANLDANVQRIQDTFEILSARNTLNYDGQFVRDIQNTIQRYERKLPSQQREVFANYVDDLQQFSGGRMPGPVYQVTRSDLSRQANAIRNTDPTLSDALRGLRNGLDNAMGRSISPADQAAWQQARRQWANWKTLEGPSKNTDAMGNVLISPANLGNAASARNRGAFARGQGDFAQLAQAGTMMKPLPQSGTTPRAIATGILSGTGFAGGGIPGAVAALALPAAGGRAIMSPLVQGYLGNQILPRVGTAAERRIARLLALETAGQQVDKDR